ncbi:MAG: peptidase S10 [Clostridiales bacterium]|nr:peptidase S10 [Clostridiales bacterium]
MKKVLTILLACCLLTLSLSAALSEAAERASREDRLSVTQHTATIQGKEIDYTVTAGTMAMSTALGDYDLFFTAYTLNDVEDPAARPVTFAYNGGPGAASAFINLGLMGPDRLSLDENGKLAKVPTGYEPNDYSLLDLTDLVFIDPVGTGYSRAAGETDQKEFYSYSSDIQSVGDFIIRYINRNQRWASPKYLAGESYGTTRTAGLCDYLMGKGFLNLNGLMMISSINNFASVAFTDGNELPYAGFLPTYAAIAHYHGKVADPYKGMDLEEYLDEVRGFAGGEYWTALFRGSRMTQEEVDAIADKMAGFIGLKKELILKKNLRIDMETFCKQLLADEKLVVGREDGRYTGPAVEGSLGSAESDPSATTNAGYIEAIRDLYTRKFQVQTDLSYEALSLSINAAWSSPEYENAILSQEKIIHDCMSKNPMMKVWVICGYYDQATPFFAAEWTYSHLFLDSNVQDNLSFTYYPSGHMFYQHEPSLQKFRKDAEAWYQ